MKSNALVDSSRASIVTVAMCYMIAVFEGFDLQAAGVAAPKLGPAFQMTPGAMGWFFSSSTFGLMLGAALGGRLSDRFGRKSVLIYSVGMFGLMSVFTGLAPGVDALLLARFMTGVGIGGALPNLVSLVAENTKPSRRNTAVGLLYAGLPSGGALASLVSALGSGGDSWSTVFFVGGVAPLLAIPLLWFVLPESQQLEAVKQAHGGRLERTGYAFALLGEQRAGRSLLLWAAFFLSLLTMYLLLNWLPTLLVSRGLSRADASLVQLSFNVLGALASMSTGLLMDRADLSKVVVGSFGAAAVSLWLLSNVAPQLVLAMAVGGFVGIAMSATQALLYALAPTNYPTAVRGTGVGSAVAIGRLGSAVGPLLAGALLAAGKAPQDVLLLLVPIIVTAGVGALTLVAMMRRAEERSA
jgi:AAHS family 3-hydroxyphenylpropionic acid transporter